MWTALAACTAFGAGVGITQGIREGYYLPVTAVAVALLTAGMFGLLTASGFYLGLVRGNSPLSGRRRQLAEAAVITCIGVLIPFALRYHLWWLVGSDNTAAGLSSFCSSWPSRQPQYSAPRTYADRCVGCTEIMCVKKPFKSLALKPALDEVAADATD